MMHARVTSGAEWRAHWPLVLTAFLGMSFPPVAIYSLGVVIDPLTREFGWSRTLIMAGASIAAAVAIPCSPLVGALIDRWGVRRLALPGLVLTGISIACLGLANGSATQWMALWGFYAVVALFLKSTMWTTAVSGAFTAGRSLALAITLAGSSMATTVTPPLMRWLTDTYGWREAYAAIALGWGLPTLVLGVFFLFDARDRSRLGVKGASATAAVADLPGLTLREAARSMILARIALATLITLLLTGILVIHKVPILIAVGVPRADAALLAGLSGLAGLLGNLTAGWLMQRFDAGWVAAVTNSMMAASLVPLLEPFRTPTLIVASMLVVGFAGGSKLQLCAYLTSMYAGLRNFGKIYGVMSSIVASTGAAAGLLGGLIYDATGSYDALIIAGIPGSLVAAVLLIRLGPFPDWNRPLGAG